MSTPWKDNQPKPRGLIMWTTDRELRFIDALGSFSKQNGPNPDKPTRLRLLKNYRDMSCKVRKEWGEMDKTVVLGYVTRLIEEVENGRSSKEEVKDGSDREHGGTARGADASGSGNTKATTA